MMSESRVTLKEDFFVVVEIECKPEVVNRKLRGVVYNVVFVFNM